MKSNGRSDSKILESDTGYHRRLVSGIGAHVQGTGKDSGGKRIEDNEVHMMLLEYLQSSVHTCEFSPRLICLERIAGSCEFSS